MDKKDFDNLVKDLEILPEVVMDEAEPVMKKATPKRSGNARNKTNLKSGTTTILADYDYAGRLDEGWSKQAPNGFTDQTIDFIDREISRQVGRLWWLKV